MSAADSNGGARVPAGVRTMAIVRWALVVAMGLGATLSVAYATGALSKRQAGGDHAATLYQCPMHPAVVQDHPGECPICGMTLVPKLAGRPDAGKSPSVMPGLAQVALAPERIQLIGMRTAKVERATLGDALRATGIVAPNERGLSQVSARFAGWIQTLAVSETGRHVKRGEVLATVYSPDVLQAEQEFLTARGWTSKPGDSTGAPSGDLAAAARRRLELLGIAGAEIDALGTRGKAGDSVPIRSPVEGYVTVKNVVPGAAIQPGAPLFEVADLSKVWLLADVFEHDAARISIGQKATLTLVAFPDERFAGHVQLIAPTLDTATRTLRVRLELANKPGPGGVKLRPGMSGTVSFELPAASGLVVPSEALVDTGERQYVFVAKDGGRFEPRPVRAGARSGDNVQVLEGVSEGETVVTTGNFLLDSESRLRAAVEGEK